VGERQTFWPTHPRVTLNLVKEIGRRIASMTDDGCEIGFLHGWYIFLHGGIVAIGGIERTRMRMVVGLSALSITIRNQPDVVTIKE
jgi:hypothetical protein